MISYADQIQKSKLVNQRLAQPPISVDSFLPISLDFDYERTSFKLATSGTKRP